MLFEHCSRWLMLFSAMAASTLHSQQRLSGRFEITDSQGVIYYVTGHPERYCTIYLVFPRKGKNNMVEYSNSPDDVRSISSEDCLRVESLTERAIERAAPITEPDVKPGYLVRKSAGQTKKYFVNPDKQEFRELDRCVRGFWLP